MTNKKNKNQDGLSGNWKKLAPKSSRKPASRAAFRKRLLGITKVFALIVVLCLVGIVVQFFQERSQPNSGPLDITGSGMPVSKLMFVSDGVLHKNWFQNWFGPLRNRTLMDLDIEKIQKELKKESQISFARVSRQFPSTLKIELKEKKPILRLCLRSKTKGEQTWLVSSDGSLYLGTCYSNASLVHLPFLDIEPSLLTPNPEGKAMQNWRASLRSHPSWNSPVGNIRDFIRTGRLFPIKDPMIVILVHISILSQEKFEIYDLHHRVLRHNYVV